MKKESKFSNLIFILLIVIICMLTITKFCENDLFFDIKTGESILKYGIDFKEHFSFIPNLTYLYHHWLYDLLIYFIYKLFSYGGIFSLYLFIYILLGMAIYYVNLNYSKNKFISFITAITTILMCKSYIQTRVQTITYLLFFLELFCLEKLYQSGNKKYPIYLIILSIIIVNFHMPFWLFTIILTLPYLIELFLNLIKDSFKKFKSNKIILENAKNSNLFITTFYVLALSGLISPYMFKPYTFFLKALGNESFDFILEMQKTTPVSNTILLILIIISLFIIIVLNTKIKLRDLLLIAGLSLFSLFAKRNIVFVYLIFPTLIIKILYYNYDFSKIKNKWKKLKQNKLLSIFNYIGIIFKQRVMHITLILFLSITIIVGINSANLKKFYFLINDGYPVKSVEYIKKNLDYKNIKLYTEFNYGSYVAFNDIPIFVDSRAEVYIKEFNGGQDIIKDYLDVENFYSYKSVFNKYQFDYALVYYNSNIYHYLNNDKDYELLYKENEDYALFKKIV